MISTWLSFLQAPKPITETSVEGGVKIVRHARAKKLTLRLAPDGNPRVTAPKRTSKKQIMEFVARHQHWLNEQREKHGVPELISDGALIPLRGVPHKIQSSGSLRGRIEVLSTATTPTLVIPGDPAATARRLRSFLMAEARRDCIEALAHYAARIGRATPPLSLRDPKSRWGSCSAKGAIMLSWRLIMAPPEVLRYVVAHEVAHCVVFDHSPAFWAEVARLDPDYKQSQRWLKQHGRSLHSYALTNNPS